MTQKTDSPGKQEPPRRRGGLISFGADVRKQLAPLLGKKGFIQADILAHWEDILGKALSQGIFPVSVAFNKTGQAVLNVKAVSGAYAVEFMARTPEILQRINSYFGYPAVTDIRITQGAVPAKKPVKKKNAPPVCVQKQDETEQLVSGIEDENLRRAAAELGTLIG